MLKFHNDVKLDLVKKDSYFLLVIFVYLSVWLLGKPRRSKQMKI